MSEIEPKQAGEQADKNQVGKKVRKQKPALNFLLLSAGSVFTSMIVAGFLVGYAFDMLFDTTPLFLLSCGVLGFVGGMINVHKLLGKMELLDEKPMSSVSDSNQSDKE